MYRLIFEQSGVGSSKDPVKSFCVYLLATQKAIAPKQMLQHHITRHDNNMCDSTSIFSLSLIITSTESMSAATFF